MNKPIFWILALLVLGIAVAGAYYKYHKEEDAGGRFRLAPVEQGDLIVNIGATGTLEPEEVIDVGAQVAGRICEFGQDDTGAVVDYGSTVEEGTVLARIDAALYRSDVANADAQLQQARASVSRAQADLEQMRARLAQAEFDWNRQQGLPSEVRSPSEDIAYKTAYESARAQVDVGAAAIQQAEATVAQAEAQFDRARQNLGYCTIASPVKGIVIDRRVNIGQTVVASLSAPSLFLIAKDLKRLEVWASVNEADIGRVHAGQPVSFTVDAYPDQSFRGAVGKVRLNATMTQNVVTYTVEIVADNPDGILLPYLTANVQFEVARRANVLMVPNAALRYTPTPERIAPDARSNADNPASRPATRENGDRPRHAGGGATAPGTAPARKRPSRVWVANGEMAHPINVRVGLTDGTKTEVESDELKPGDQVILGEYAPSAGASDAGGSNPFMPQPMRSRRPQ